MQSSFTGFSPKIFRPTDLDRKLFWRFDPWRWKLKEGRKKKQVSSIFSNNEYRGGIFLHNSTIYQLFQNLVFKSSIKTFKPYHCHKLILNNINKMGIFQRCIQNPIKHLRSHFSQKYITAENVKCFCEKINLRCLTGFWIRLCILAIIHWPIPEKYSTIIPK